MGCNLPRLWAAPASWGGSFHFRRAKCQPPQKSQAYARRVAFGGGGSDSYRTFVMHDRYSNVPSTWRLPWRLCVVRLTIVSVIEAGKARAALPAGCP